jgi:hypothetical protein
MDEALIDRAPATRPATRLRQRIPGNHRGRAEAIDGLSCP